MASSESAPARVTEAYRHAVQAEREAKDQSRRDRAAEAMRTLRADLAANTTDEQKAAAAIRANEMKATQRKRARLNKLGDDATEADRVWLAANPGRVVGKTKRCTLERDGEEKWVASSSYRPTIKRDGMEKWLASSSCQPTIERDGEEKWLASTRCQPTVKRDGRAEYSQSSQAQRNATESARLARARGEGETEDGLSREERVAQGTRVAARISQLALERLASDECSVGYIAVGTDERMHKNWLAAEANGYKGLGKCEILRTLLCQRPSVYALDANGKARRFDCALVREGLKAGNIRVDIDEERMYSQESTKLSEVLSHEATMFGKLADQMFMKGVSLGGPKQGHANGHRLGFLTLDCGPITRPRYLVPRTWKAKLSASASPVFDVSDVSRWQQGNDLLELEDKCEESSSSDAATPPSWKRIFVCKERNPNKLSSIHDKYWTCKFKKKDASLTYTWGSLKAPYTNQLRFVFGSGNGVAASGLGDARCMAKLSRTETRAPYNELQPGEGEALPSLLRPTHVEAGKTSEALEPESDDEGDDMDDDMDDGMDDDMVSVRMTADETRAFLQATHQEDDMDDMFAFA